MTTWYGKPYNSLDASLKEMFGEKIYKISLDGGMTCPNRDGLLGTRGCIFCSNGGSGEFAEKHRPDINTQIELAKKRVSSKHTGSRYLAYFQSHTNTYAPVSYLEPLFTQAITHPDIAGLSIATRPDCLSDEVLSLLKQLRTKKPVWVELGLQTIHEESAVFIRRGYPLSCFLDALERIKRAGLFAVVHVILGLPGETKEMMFETIRFLGRLPIDGIKLQLLHILEGTDLGSLYRQKPFPLFSLEEYTELICDCISQLPPSIVIHRISGDGPKNLLIAPKWSANKRLVLNTITRRLKERGIYQGCACGSTTPESIPTP